jgi:hypothetical protein
MLHSLHADIQLHGLADHCDRCSYHAEHLAELDTTTLFQLKGRLDTDQPPRSGAEALAMRNLDTIVLLAKRLGLREAVNAS